MISNGSTVVTPSTDAAVEEAEGGTRMKMHKSDNLDGSTLATYRHRRPQTKS